MLKTKLKVNFAIAAFVIVVTILSAAMGTLFTKLPIIGSAVSALWLINYLIDDFIKLVKSIEHEG